MTARTVSPARRRSRQRQRPSQPLTTEHRWLLGEISFKLGLNALLLVVAGGALMQLFPHQQNQLAQLEAIEMQVAETEARVQQLRQDFQRSFDPSQSHKIMEELSPRQNPHQRRIILTQP